MPSANQLANTYYRRYRGLKRRVKDLEGQLTTKDAEIRRLNEYVKESGIKIPQGPGRRPGRRTGMKYAPRGGAWAPPPSSLRIASKEKIIAPRTLKPAPPPTPKKEEGSQESQSSGLDALGMLASQYLDSQTPKSQPSQQFPPSSSQYVPSTPYKAPKATLLSPLPLPTKRRRHGSNSSTEHDPAMTESEKSPTKIRVLGDSDDEVAIKESPPSSLRYGNALPIPYRAAVRTNGPEAGSGPARRLDFEGGGAG